MRKQEIEKRLNTAIFACRSAGLVLMGLKNTELKTRTIGDQLKSEADEIVDDLIRVIITGQYPNDFILSEETARASKGKLQSTGQLWVVDPLDGTRSFHEGYIGFCVQMAFFSDGKLKFGVVYWPARDTVYWALSGRGAYKKTGDKKTVGIHVSNRIQTYVESRPASENVLKILKKLVVDTFIECGSYGLKICKVAEGEADVFIKEHEFKIWDTAPGNLILDEAGGILLTWSGQKISYSDEFEYQNLIACSKKNSSLILSKIASK